MPTEKKYSFSGNNGKVTIKSSTPFKVIGKAFEPSQLRYSEEDAQLYKSFKSPKEPGKKLRLAYVCNWNQHCGISTYSRLLQEQLSTKTDEISDFTIFSEHGPHEELPKEINYCWKRGEPLDNLLTQLLAYAPDFVLIQHEWGVWPNVRYFMNFLLSLKRFDIKYSVVLHSVWDNQDKSLVTAIMENVVLHSYPASACLHRNGFRNHYDVIPHGCPPLPASREPIWNNLKTPYSIFSYGFGFQYKGVDTAIKAVAHLVKTDSKFENMLYVYQCSESENNTGVHDQYMEQLNELVDSLGVRDNVILMRGYMEDAMLDRWLRMAKMAVFPYVVDEHGVYGSSGAVKIAMSYDLPVIASKSRLFDDIEGYVPRVSDHLELAAEIDRIFSNSNTRRETIGLAHEYIKKNSWQTAGNRYMMEIREIWEKD